MSKIANLGGVSALLGLIILFALPVGHLDLYTSSTCLLLGSILGLAYTLQPRLKPKDEDIALIMSLECVAFILSLLKYFKTATFATVLLGTIPIIPTIAMLVVATYRNKK